MLSMTILISASMCMAGIDELQLSDFFPSWENKVIFPPLEERELLDNAEVKELQNLWEYAQETGLVKDRHKIWLKMLGGDSTKYLTSFLKYRNPEIIELVEEMFFWEYECAKSYEYHTPKRVEAFEQARCAEEVPVMQEEETCGFETGYSEMVGQISVSTLSPKIFDATLESLIAVGGSGLQEYYSRVNVEEHLLAILNGTFIPRSSKDARGVTRTSVLIEYNVRGFAKRRAPHTDQIVHMLVINPALAIKHEEEILQFSKRLRSSEKFKIHDIDERALKRLVGHANRLERDLDRIIGTVKEE